VIRVRGGTKFPQPIADPHLSPPPKTRARVRCGRCNMSCRSTARARSYVIVVNSVQEDPNKAAPDPDHDRKPSTSTKRCGARRSRPARASIDVALQELADGVRDSERNVEQFKQQNNSSRRQNADQRSAAGGVTTQLTLPHRHRGGAEGTR